MENVTLLFYYKAGPIGVDQALHDISMMSQIYVMHGNKIIVINTCL